MIDISVILALVSLFIYGLTQVISKATVRSISSTSMIALNFLVSMPIYFVFLVGAVFVMGYGNIPIEYIAFGIVGAVTARTGYYLYLEGLEKGSVTMVGSITAAYPAITVALAVSFLGERLLPVNFVGIVLIISSMVALSYFNGRAPDELNFSRAALVISIAVLLLWGVGGVFIKASLSGMPLIGYLGLYPFILPPLAIAYLRYRRATRATILPRWAVPVAGAVIVAELWQLGYFAETAAVSAGSASIVYPIISAYPVVTIVAAHFTLREKVSRTDWILLFPVILGVVLTSIS